MMCAILTLLVAFVQDTVPFKPDDEFELKMDYQFKQRTVNNREIDFNNLNRTGSGPLPFLSLSLKILKSGEGEARIKIVTNTGEQVVSRKLKEGMVIDFDAGFTADLKDRVGPHEFTVLFLSDKRKVEQSKIVIHIAEDGTFIVNDVVRGKL